MIRLNLSNQPEWLDLLPGLRVLVAPLTTALMVSARADPMIDNLSEASSQEDMALRRSGCWAIWLAKSGPASACRWTRRWPG
ncbi:hypothetical protein ACFOMH_19910 [Paracoccus mangrovi]|uniref:Uncharacterized protein n=1 Tax=Paracoccus mangrovi TaxID=1715645 RepID=A0ABV7RAH7_9RHOB